MKYIVPEYYSEFTCIAGACRHSCCAGWEIDIDEESLEKYLAMDGETGRRLHAQIDTSGDTACFRMTEDERCPFLNRDGLCELILAEGEDILCQICADHPRFRNFYQDREEIGLGLCCEAAVRLILTRREPVRLIEIDDDGYDDGEDEAEQALLELRSRLIEGIQDRTLPVEERVRRMTERMGVCMPAGDDAAWAGFLLTLERMDEDWARRLEALRDAPADGGTLPAEEQWEIAFEQLMVCLLYRHIPGALRDGDLSGRVQMAVLFWRLIRRMCCVQLAAQGCLTMEDLVETVRLYSSEIEYSDVNIDAVLDRIGEETE